MDNTASCMIEVCDLHKHYKDVHVLRGISTTVAKGEVCAVIGPSGSGKSTFLRCLNRLEEASSGEIFINAQEITDPHLNLNKMRENIGMVFQGFNLFPHMTAIQNIMLAPVNVRGLSHKEAEAYGMELLSRVGLADKHASYPDMLSGGQQQRLALARAFLTDKPIVIMDEPTTGLDGQLSLKVMKALKDMAKEKTVIMVTHNPAEVALSDRVVVVEKGKISADGKPQDLIKSNEFLRSFLTKEDIKTKRRLYNMSINGANPMQEAAELLNGEAGGRILSDAERAEKRRLLEAHKRAYVGVRKNALKSERVKLGKDLPEKKERQPLQPVPAVPVKGGAEM